MPLPARFIITSTAFAIRSTTAFAADSLDSFAAPLTVIISSAAATFDSVSSTLRFLLFFGVSRLIPKSCPQISEDIERLAVAQDVPINNTLDGVVMDRLSIQFLLVGILKGWLWGGYY